MNAVAARFVAFLALLLLILLQWSGSDAAPQAGGAGLGLKFRGRKFSYSPVTSNLYATGDFVHIRAGCADEQQLLQPTVNYTVEYWGYLDPPEIFDAALIPHFFSMAQEYNFHVNYAVNSPDGNIYWFWVWITACGVTTGTTPYGNIMIPKTWMHFAIVNNNGNITTYQNGEPTGTFFCNAPFNTPPVWMMGARDWSTETNRQTQLTPYYSLAGSMADFRFWSRPLSRAEITSRLQRTLTPAEQSDPSLLVYFDLRNADGHVIPNLATRNRRIQGFMGGALGLEASRPAIEPSSAPLVNTWTSERTVRVVMKESGDYQSTIIVPISAIEDSTGSLLSANAATYRIESFPNSRILTLSRQAYGVAPYTAGPSANIGNAYSLYVTHVRDDSVQAWADQTFTVSVTVGGNTILVPVTVTIRKNAAPILGDTGGAIVPPDVPTDASLTPLYSTKNLVWKNDSFNLPITFEFWFVTTLDNKAIYFTDIQNPNQGRINAEVNKNLNFDYGWDYDNSGRTFVPIRHKFGIWSHAAMVSNGKGGVQNLYLNGELVASAPGNVPVRGKSGDPPVDAAGNFYSNLTANLAIDELRIWSTNRSIAEIRRDMFRTLTGKEPNLYLYHNFDSHTVNKDGSLLFKDLGPNGYDLVCKGFTKPGDCPLVRSQGIPIGGQITDITFADGAPFAYWDPQGMDVDDDSTFIRFVVDELPRDAQLVAEKNVTLRGLDGDTRNGISKPQYISNVTEGAFIRKTQFIPAVQIVPSALGGGNPYTSFKYHVTDGLRNSAIGTVNIYRKCPPGTYLDQARRQCILCSPGFYSTTFSYNDKCLPCPVGTSQPRAGSALCVPCEQALFISFARAINTTTNTPIPYPATLPTTTVGVEDVSSFGTFQDQAAQSMCKPCLSLSYATQSGATSCDGQAFIPKYVALGGIESLFVSPAPEVIPSTPFNATTNNTVKSVVLSTESKQQQQQQGGRISSVLQAPTNDVLSALNDAGVLTAPRAVLATSIVVAVITLLGLVGIYVFSGDPVIKASSPICLTFTAVGIMMGVMSTVTYSVRPTVASCVSEIWIYPISWSLVMGTLISKTFRILRIFNNPRALKIRMTNWDLFGYMFAAVAVNIVILLVWSIYDAPAPITVQRGNAAGLIFISCSSRSSVVQSAFTAVLYLYNATLLCILCLLAFLTRNVNALFSESKYIGYFVYTSIGSLGIFVPLTYMPSNDIMTVYAFKSIAIIVTSASAMVTLIGVKFYTIFQNRQTEAVGGVKSSAAQTLMSSASIETASGGKRVAFGAAIVNQFKDKMNSFTAPVVYSSKKVGVVFWKSKVAVLNTEHRILYLVSVDPISEKDLKAKGPQVVVPETIVFPMTKVVSCLMDPSSQNQTSTSNSAEGATTTMGGTGGGTIVSLTNTETNHMITIQFESAQSRKDFEAALKKLGGDVTIGAEKKGGGSSVNQSKSVMSSASMM
ncbi:hypothetical protein HDV05_006703 [Chytridiales sp. JEL 0842]|nr:hypothetical protein HDV05_006703 [Chytridiales sp. JEL 0842]